MAQASSLAGLPEQACAQALVSLTIARGTGSPRTLHDLRNLLDSLTQGWPALREVDQLRESLATAATC